MEKRICKACGKHCSRMKYGLSDFIDDPETLAGIVQLLLRPIPTKESADTE